MAVMNLEYIKKMTQIYKETKVPFEEALEVFIRAYNQLNENEQKEFCEWLAGPRPERGLRAQAHIIEDACNLSQEEIDKIVEVWSNVPNY